MARAKKEKPQPVTLARVLDRMGMLSAQIAEIRGHDGSRRIEHNVIVETLSALAQSVDDIRTNQPTPGQQSSCSRPANPGEPNHIGAVGLNEIAVRWIIRYVRDEIASSVIGATYARALEELNARVAKLENNQQRFR